MLDVIDDRQRGLVAHVVFTFPQTRYMVLRLFRAEYPQIIRRHPGSEVEVQSWVSEDNRCRPRNGGMMFEDADNNCCADIASSAISANGFYSC
jgi:hypothetical protein